MFYVRVKTIPLTQGFRAIVDDEDFDRVSRYKWIAWTKKENGRIVQVYASRTFRRPNGKQRTEQLHRFILDIWDERHVDHINRDALDCSRDNMRTCTNQQNNYNKGKRRDSTSGYKGVSWYPRYGKWVVRIGFGKSRRFLGYFTSPEAAALAYNEAAKKLHGDFAVLNRV